MFTGHETYPVFIPANQGVYPFGVPAERRAARRYPYPALVRIDPEPGIGLICLRGTGIDISTSGLGVHLPEPLPIGEEVTVVLGGGFGGPDEISAQARVVRVARNSRGFTVGFMFLDQSLS